MNIDPKALDDKGLDNLIENYRRKSATDQQIYIDALAERAKRKGKGLDFDTTMRVIREASAQGRFLSYGELAEASGADWNQVRYAIGPHLDSLIEFCHRNGLPLLSAIVVNKPNVKSGDLEPESLKGFIAGARAVGISVTDNLLFLREQQTKVFEWGRSQKFTGLLPSPARD
jgi:hypothetical protein